MSIIQPQQNQTIAPGTDILLHGAATDGDPETRRAPRVESVTYQIDGGTSQPLAHTDTVYYWSTHVIYQQNIGTLPGGNHTITVTTRFSLDTIEDSVTVQVGTSLPSLFAGTATLKTSYSNAPGPFASQVTIGIMFSPDRKIVTITNFPTITTPTIPLPWPLGSDTVTVTKTGGGIGGFDPTSGAMGIPITLHFHHSNSLLSDSDLELVLSTGSEQSPHGFFKDQGSPMQSGRITLVGDGAFSGGVLGGSDASLIVAGTVTPSP